MERTPGVDPAGRDDLYRQFVDALWNRLCVVDYRKRHPEVKNEWIERPLVILGLPRTGTTPASYMLGQDSARRSLLNLLRRVFALDILACPDCGGRLRLLATIEDRAVVEKILTHLGLPVDLPQPSAARTPAWLPGVRDRSRSRARRRRPLGRLTTHRRTPFQAAEQHWRRTAAPAPVPDNPFSGVS